MQVTTNIMTLQSRMQLHTLVYRIVSMRIDFAKYEDSASSRGRLEAETHKRICKLKVLENKSELEVAQTLCDSYQEKLGSLPVSYAMAVARPPRTVGTTILKVV